MVMHISQIIIAGTTIILIVVAAYLFWREGEQP